MKGLQSKGMEEVNSFKNRITRLYAMDRISEEDFNRLHDKVSELKELIEEVSNK